MKDLYIRFFDVILVDSTYKTNRFNMPLIVFCGINEDAKTLILGFAAVQSEREEHVRWTFEKLFDDLETVPEILGSDSCSTLRKVIKSVLLDTRHLLCGWHVNQNVAKHLGPISKIVYYIIFNFTWKNLMQSCINPYLLLRLKLLESI